METNNLFNNLIQRNQSAAFSSGKVRPNHETNINIIARRTGKDVNSHTVLDGIITTIMATIQRINIIGSREGKSVDRKSGSAGMPRPISYAVFCLKKKIINYYLSFIWVVLFAVIAVLTIKDVINFGTDSVNFYLKQNRLFVITHD